MSPPRVPGARPSSASSDRNSRWALMTLPLIARETLEPGGACWALTSGVYQRRGAATARDLTRRCKGFLRVIKGRIESALVWRALVPLGRVRRIGDCNQCPRENPQRPGAGVVVERLAEVIVGSVVVVLE